MKVSLINDQFNLNLDKSEIDLTIQVDLISHMIWKSWSKHKCFMPEYNTKIIFKTIFK